MARSPTPAVELFKFPGLSSSRIVLESISPSVRRSASHNDIALNYLERGWVSMLTATGYRGRLNPGRLVVFWGAIPHKIDTFDPRNIYHSLVLPIGTFLRWSMPETFTRQLLAGRVFIETDPAQAPLDLALLNRWHGQIVACKEETTKIVLLELEARLRRMAWSSSSSRSVRHLKPRGTASRAERMLLLIAENFRQPLLPRDVAAAVGLHPDNAGRLFRERLGVSLTDYIAQCRVSHAKALLATTDTKMVDVALDSGFGSAGHFHSIFKRLAGCTPRAYRMKLRQSTQG